MRRTETHRTVLAAAFALSAAAANRRICTAPTVGGKRHRADENELPVMVFVGLRMVHSLGCQNNAGLGTFGKDRFGRWIIFDVAAKTSQILERFAVCRMWRSDRQRGKQ